MTAGLAAAVAAALAESGADATDLRAYAAAAGFRIVSGRPSNPQWDGPWRRTEARIARADAFVRAVARAMDHARGCPAAGAGAPDAPARCQAPDVPAEALAVPCDSRAGHVDNSALAEAAA